MESDAVRLPADELRGLAAVIRANPHHREAIANGFELIAEAMSPCFDCGCPELMDDFSKESTDSENERVKEFLKTIMPGAIAPEDNPETGAGA